MEIQRINILSNFETNILKSTGNNFIKKYTLPDEIVLDPFCGSGVSVSEAVFNGRKGVGIDINPSSILITKNVIQNIDIKLALGEFNKI